jgi:hypothetical protein
MRWKHILWLPLVLCTPRCLITATNPAAQQSMVLLTQKWNELPSFRDHVAVCPLSQELFCRQLSKSGKRTFEDLKNRLFLLTPQTFMQAGSLPKTQKTESKLAKLRHTNSLKGFNFKFKMI